MKILVVDDEALLVKGIRFNLQNEGYDEETAAWILEKGNYVIAGGDFNQSFPGTLDTYPIRDPEKWTPGVLENAMLPEGWQFACDISTPTCRLLDQPYSPACQLYVIDGFILSPNVRLESVQTQDLNFENSDIPPIATLEGVDLVTEGVITVNKVVEYAKDYLGENELYEDWNFKKDGASLISRLLFEEATDINFYVGRAVNPAHQNPDLPINFNIKMNLVEELSACLKKMGKRIKVSYF